MSGFAGIWTQGSDPVQRSILKSMSSTIAHRGIDGEFFHIENDFGLAFQLTRVTPEETNQPLVDSRGVCLAFDGRLDNRKELFSYLGSELKELGSDAEYVLAAYAEWGEGFVEKLHGEYAFVLFDKTKQHLLLVRDVVGVRPLYYYRGSNFFVFGSELKALLVHPQVSREPSDDGLAEFLIGFTKYDASLTCFKSLYAVEPGQIIKLQNGELTKRNYWDFDGSKEIKLSSFEEYSEAFYDLFKQSVLRRLRSAYPVAFSVSGGLDSSSIFGMAITLSREGRSTAPLSGVTCFGKRTSKTDELVFLEELEKKYEIKIDRIDIDPLLDAASGIEEVISQVEVPMTDPLWRVSREAYMAMGKGGARTILSGHWGDQILCPHAYLIDLVKSFSWLTVRRHIREFPRWYAGDGEGKPPIVPFIKSVLRTTIPRSLHPPLRKIKRHIFPPPHNYSVFSNSFFDGRQVFETPSRKSGKYFHSEHAKETYDEVKKKHTIISLEWNNKTAALRHFDWSFPMLDRDLLSFVMAIPGEVLNWRGIPRGLLRYSMSGVLPEAIAKRNWKGDYTDPVNEGLNRHLESVSRQLNGSSQIVQQSYVNPKKLTEEMEKVRTSLKRDDCSSTWTISDLYAFEIWLKLFSKRKIYEQKESQKNRGGQNPEKVPISAS